MRFRIPKDRYIEVHGSLRRQIRTSIEFKTRLRKITWTLLDDFARMVRDFDQALISGKLTAEHFLASCASYGRLLALTEFNGMLPLEWYEDELVSLQIHPDPVKYEDFTYSEVLPHRALLRWGKLRLLRQYYQNGGWLKPVEVDRFIATFGYLDPNTNWLLFRASEDPEKVIEEIHMMARSTDRANVAAELKALFKVRLQSKRHYLRQLQRVDEALLQRKASSEYARNLISALSIISLAMTEEEYRHILQDRYQRALGAILRGLELPAHSSIADIAATIRQRPHFIPDMPGRRAWEHRGEPDYAQAESQH